MEQDETRPSFFRYKVLEDETILERQTLKKRVYTACQECCSSLPRCLNLAKFIISLAVSVTLTMGPWALAITEAIVQTLLYSLVLYGGHWRHVAHIHYNWWKSEEDVVLLSYFRCLVGLAAFCLGLWKRDHKPYLITACGFACIGLVFIAVKAIMLQQKLVSKWGSLLLSSAIFSVIHIVAAVNVYLFARMQRRVTSLAHDVENPADHRGSSFLSERDLAGEKSHFIKCGDLVVHYTVTLPLVSRKSDCFVVLVHGFGEGTFSWRLMADNLAGSTGMPVYSFDRPGFGLTSRPILSQEDRHSIGNPYQLPFQADLILRLCELWGFKRVVLVGHSDGALLVLHTAAQALRHRAYMERNSLEGRVKQASNKQKGSARSSSSVEDESLVYSEPYREPNEDIQNLAEQNSFDGPSSPFSKWLQLGQPPDPASLQPKLNKIGCEAPPLSRQASSGQSVEHCLPSFQLEEVSALLGPERHRFTGISTTVDRSNERGWHIEQLNETVEVVAIVMLNPCFDGQSKPAIARVLSSSRMGRHVLCQVLQNEIGEIRNRRAWFDSNKMKQELLKLYSQPLQFQNSAQGIVEASRLQKELQQSQIQQDLKTLEQTPKLFLSGDADDIAPRAETTELDFGVNSDFGVLSGCGHFCTEEQPSQATAHITSFITRLGLVSSDHQPMIISSSPFQCNNL